MGLRKVVTVVTFIMLLCNFAYVYVAWDSHSGSMQAKLNRLAPNNTDTDTTEAVRQSVYLVIADLETMASKIRTREDLWKKASFHLEQSMGKKRKRLPSVIGIGVKKCGTGGVIRFLMHHPLIVTPLHNKTETFFFTNYNKDRIYTYGSHFPPSTRKQRVMEKTPAYFDYPPHKLPENIKDALPWVKLILVVCDPTTRMFSDYNHERNYKALAKFASFDEYVDNYIPKVEKLLNNTDTGDFEVQKALTNIFKYDRAAAVTTTGLYSYHIQRWTKFFESSRLLLVDGDKFVDNPGPIIEEIEDFLRLPKLLLKEDFVRNPQTGFFCYRKFTEKYLNSSFFQSHDEFMGSLQCLPKGKGKTRKGHKSMSISSINRVKKFYAPFNRRFYELVNRTFNWM